jgi:ATP-dependent Clp protease adaptor protein ClpS
VLDETRQKTREPIRYQVTLLNDDYTTMEFVVQVLESVFNKTPAEAYGIMMRVHTEGRGRCGAYTHEIAETKVATTRALAAREGFPLQAVLEEE